MSDKLSGKYAIVGIGQSPIGEVPGMNSLSLLALAMKNAIEDAGLAKGEVDGLISRGTERLHTHHQHMGRILGLDASFSTSLDNGGASQCLAVALACMAIDAGLCHTVVCGYGRDTWSRTRSPQARMQVSMLPDELLAKEFGPEFGLFGAVADYAFAASRHTHLYGTTKEQLGSIAVTLRKHASKNPAAQKREPLTMEQYLNARLIVAPLGLYDCSLLSDGAGAVVVTSSERAKDLKRAPVHILGFGSHNNLRGWHYDDYMVETAAKKAPPPLTAWRESNRGMWTQPSFMTASPTRSWSSSKTTAFARRARAAPSPPRAPWTSTALCRPTRPAVSSPKATSKACSRYQKP